MSSTESTPIHPMHDPAKAAHVSVPQAPLGNADSNRNQGLGTKALLAKKLAKGSNPKFVSPTDNMMTPVSKKLTAQKQKHFQDKKSTKGMKSLDGAASSSDDEGDENMALDSPAPAQLSNDLENPF